MNNFCSNCGEKLHENADFCVKCGVAIRNNINKPKQEGRGCGIASLILGISGLIQGVFSAFIFMCLVLDGDFFYFEEKIIFGFFFLFTPTVLSIIGLPLGISSRNKNNNGINLTGIILNLITLSICVLSFASLVLM